MRQPEDRFGKGAVTRSPLRSVVFGEVDLVREKIKRPVLLQQNTSVFLRLIAITSEMHPWRIHSEYLHPCKSMGKVHLHLDL